MNIRSGRAWAALALALALAAGGAACGGGPGAAEQASLEAVRLTCARVQDLSDAWTLWYRIKPVVDRYDADVSVWTDTLSSSTRSNRTPMPGRPPELAQRDRLAPLFVELPKAIGDAANMTTDAQLQRLALELRGTVTAAGTTKLATRCTELGRAVRPPVRA